jgi:hypothetical protein
MKQMVGAGGFACPEYDEGNHRPPGPELVDKITFIRFPANEWDRSRTNHVNPITLYCGVAYGTRSVFSPLQVVPNLYLDRFSVESRLGVENEIPLRFLGGPPVSE